MKRRSVLKSMLAMPAIPAAAQYRGGGAAAEDNPKLSLSGADAVADGVTRFFTAPQLAALRRLGEILMPAVEGRPGAKEAGAAEFLDFLLGQSPAARQKLYRDGLDRLNAGKPFADLSAADAEQMLAPLREPWTYRGPSNPFARFLQAAKMDFMAATANSREWAGAQSSRRGAAGLGLYWHPIE